jgi:hypothetical protein
MPFAWSRLLHNDMVEMHPRDLTLWPDLCKLNPAIRCSAFPISTSIQSYAFPWSRSLEYGRLLLTSTAGFPLVPSSDLASAFQGLLD